MTRLIRYLTHPQIHMDPDVPVPMWGLSDVGRARTQALTAVPWLGATARIISSAERKAIETATIIGTALGIEIEVRERMHENDRSATGFLPPAEFEEMANRFFANPTTSVRGWERAIDAQARIVGEVESLLAADRDGDLLIVGHGGVGTLLYCHYAALPIDRIYDQPAGGGNYFTASMPGKTLLHGWRPMEDGTGS